MHIQKVFVILAFNNQLMETVISLLVQIPVVGSKLEAPVRAILGQWWQRWSSFSQLFPTFSQTEREASRGRWNQRGQHPQLYLWEVRPGNGHIFHCLYRPQFGTKLSEKTTDREEIKSLGLVKLLFTLLCLILYVESLILVYEETSEVHLDLLKRKEWE